MHSPSCCAFLITSAEGSCAHTAVVHSIKVTPHTHLRRFLAYHFPVAREGAYPFGNRPAYVSLGHCMTAKTKNSQRTRRGIRAELAAMAGGWAASWTRTG